MMQFRNFQFPSVPAHIQLRQGHRIIAHFCPGKGELLEPLGQEHQEILCAGWFWSQNREETAQQVSDFLSASQNQTPGLLFLPFGSPVYAYVKEAKLSGEGDGRIIPYRIVFVAQGVG